MAACGVVSEGLADDEPRVLLGVLDRDPLVGLRGLVYWELRGQGATEGQPKDHSSGLLCGRELLVGAWALR